MKRSELPPPFTFAAYAVLCSVIAASDLVPLRVVDALCEAPEGGFIVLRYDVDARPAHALRMAQLLHGHSLRGTFYWHAHPAALFRVDVMRQIAALGHEIGYHYATLEACGGDLDAAAAMFCREVARFHDAGFDVQTAAAHGSRHVSNLALLKQRPDLLDACGLLGEAYLSVDFSRVQYISDAGWAWRQYPLRADAQEYRARYGASALRRLHDADLLALLARPGPPLYFNTHPELWFDSGWQARLLRWRRAIGSRVLAWEPIWWAYQTFKRRGRR